MASGDTLLSFTALSNIPPSTDYATLDLRTYHPVLDFDGSTGVTEYASFEGILPSNYSGGGITLTVGTTWTSATSGVSRMGFAFERHQHNTDNIGTSAGSFAATQYMKINVSGTSGVIVYTATPFTNGAAIDSIAVGEHFRLLVCRDAVNADDDVTSDLELVSVELKET